MDATYHKDSFLFFKEPNGPECILGDRLIIEMNKIDETINYINKQNIKSITINPSYSKVNSLDFLEKIPMIEGLFLMQDGLNMSNIMSLPQLKVLRIEKSKNDLDLTCLKNLRVLSFSYNKHIKNIERCKSLFWLWIDDFNKENLFDLSPLTNLEYLSLYRSSIESLEGIGQLTNLKKIRLDTLPQLISLQGLTPTLKHLEAIYIYGAKKLRDYNSLSDIRYLKQLEIRKTGDANSIAFIKDLQHLKKVTLGFKVLDGDMSYLTGIENVGFIDFPHYSHKMKQFDSRQ